jgi:MAX-like protein X
LQVSKAVVLQKSTDYIQYLSEQKRRQEQDLNTLRKEVVALQIMRANYEQLVKAHQQAPTITEDIVPDETKFQVFQVFMDSLFQSFNQQVSMHNFAELSGCVFSWIEEQCKPGDLQVGRGVVEDGGQRRPVQDLIHSILRQTGAREGPAGPRWPHTS